MCEPTTMAFLATNAGAISAIGTGISAISMIQQGQQQQKMMEYQAAQAEADADAAQGQAMVQAEKIRRAMRSQQSQATAQMAASGVDVSQGTPEQINKEIYQRGEEDALTALITGRYRKSSLQADAAMSRISGQNAATAGWLSAGATVLSGAAKAGEKWEKAQTPKTTPATSASSISSLGGKK